MIVGMHKVGVKGIELVAKVVHPKTIVLIFIKRFERWNGER